MGLYTNFLDTTDCLSISVGIEELMGSAFAISTTPGPASSRVERMIRINVIRFFLAMCSPQ